MSEAERCCGTCRFLAIGGRNQKRHPLPHWTYRCKAETDRGIVPDSVLLGARFGPHVRKTMTGEEGVKCLAWEGRK